MQAKPTSSGDKVIQRLRHRVKSWKEKTISRVLLKEVALPEPDEISGFRDTLSEFGVPILNESERFSISRKYFEKFTKKHWVQWAELINGAFQEAKGSQYVDLGCPKRPEDVELLIITGGHSQWYIVSEYLLGKKNFAGLPAINFAKIKERQDCLVQSDDPQETVAVGLCHLDEDVVGTIAASNDVSISFTCEGKYLGACDYSIVTDKSNTINKSKIVPSDGIIATVFKAVLSVIGVALFDIPRIIYYLVRGELDKIDDTVLEKLIDSEYEIELSPDIIVNEEGIIKVGGTIKVDGETINIPEIVI